MVQMNKTVSLISLYTGVHTCVNMYWYGHLQHENNMLEIYWY